MVTMGVMDALPEGARGRKISGIHPGADIVNPTEFAAES